MGRSPAGEPCVESAPLWDAIGLPSDTPVSLLRERWTPLAAVWLAQADGRGPGVGAASWVDLALGTHVLRGANLDGANLYRANLCRANLDSASLDGANLVRASLVRANLDRANLDRAYLVRANLVRANLDGANLDGAYRPGGGVPGWEPDGDGYLKRTGRRFR